MEKESQLKLTTKDFVVVLCRECEHGEKDLDGIED